MRTPIIVAVFAVVVAVLLLVGGTMEDGPNAFLVLGLANGAVFGLVALGLVLVYKGARVFNFAHGELGTLAAYFVLIAVDDGAEFKYGLGLPYGVAIAIALIATVAVGLALERVVIRPLLNAPRITVLVATIAIALLAVGVEILLFRAEPRVMPALIQSSDAAGNPRGLEVLGFFLEPQQLIAIGVLIALAVLLAYFFSRTDLGLAVLATSQDDFATRVVGIGVERMSRFIWGSAAFLAAVGAILYLPLVGTLTPGAMTAGVLIPAFTGAVIGGMTSLPGAFLGGVVVGVVQSFAQWASGHFTLGERTFAEVVPGSEQLTLLIVLLVVLLARPQGLLGREA